MEAQSAHLDVLVARQDHLDTLYGPGFDDWGMRSFLNARRVELNAVARFTEAVKSGDEEQIGEALAVWERALADREQAQASLGPAPIEDFSR